MKAIFAISALFSCLCCVQGTDSITVEKTAENTNGATVVVLVKNRTGVDIEYYGYSKNRPQIFINEKRDGNWVETPWNWCSTGRYLLKNEEKITFEIHVTKGPIQVFTIFRNTRDCFSLVKLYEKDGDGG